MRRTMLAVTLLFIGGLLAATVYDVSRNGLSPIDLVSVLIIAFFGVAIVGALRVPPND
jgi:hypothetical protein